MFFNKKKRKKKTNPRIQLVYKEVKNLNWPFDKDELKVLIEQSLKNYYAWNKKLLKKEFSTRVKNFVNYLLSQSPSPQDIIINWMRLRSYRMDYTNWDRMKKECVWRSSDNIVRGILYGLSLDYCGSSDLYFELIKEIK